MKVTTNQVCYSEQNSKYNKSIRLHDSDIIEESNILSPQNYESNKESLSLNQTHQLPINLFYSPG